MTANGASFDLLLTGGRVVDPRNGVDAWLDVGLSGGKVAAIEAGLDPARADRVIDVSGRTVFPGLIDAHVHASKLLGGRPGFRMLAKTGVTTALEVTGPLADVFQNVHLAGAGLNVAVLNAVRPGVTVGNVDPSRADLEQMVESSLGAGAIGVKILGGHFPLTPEATERVVTAANEHAAYLVMHVSTLANRGNDLNSLREGIELAGGRPIHIAHVNAHCRGWLLGDTYAEIRQALDLLRAAPNVVCESHQGVWCGTTAHCQDGKVVDNVTGLHLQKGGYEPTEAGMRQAILDGFGRVTVLRGGEHVLVGGEEGLRAWEAAGTHTTIGFPTNPPVGIFACAAEKNADGSFVVDAMASDGGGIPRNLLVTVGLALHRMGVLSLSEVALKTTWAPAAMLGLSSKGHLGVGADADVTVLDVEREVATLAIARGQVIMTDGVVVGESGHVLTTERGLPAVLAAGLPGSALDETIPRYQKVRLER
ncbi:MAG: amidohydrolase family protein [Chloroflexi bacterium]|nr:amidohydrolase family protein [Chloroflexota bacterium]